MGRARSRPLWSLDLCTYLRYVSLDVLYVFYVEIVLQVILLTLSKCVWRFEHQRI